MGHERYRSADDILADRPVDELARRLFDSGGVTQVHANGSVITVHLAEGWTGAQLLDVIRGLYIFYPPAANGDGRPRPSAAGEEADRMVTVGPSGRGPRTPPRASRRRRATEAEVAGRGPEP